MADNEEDYFREDGVPMKPAVRVVCTDRDQVEYDREGMIIIVHGKDYFDVAFNDHLLTLSWRDITPTPEE